MITVLTKQNVPQPDIDAPICYIVTDIETDGPEPGKNSMRSFASVAVGQDGIVIGDFEGHLLPLIGASEDPGVMSFFASEPPEVWADVVRDAKNQKK